MSLRPSAFEVLLAAALPLGCADLVGLGARPRLDDAPETEATDRGGGASEGNVGVGRGDASVGAGEASDAEAAIVRFRSVAAGGRFSCALDDQGRLRTWGGTASATLGRPSLTLRDPVPRVVPTLERVSAVSAGRYTACAQGEARTLWCWGMNTDGQLGRASLPLTNTPVLVEGDVAFAHVAVGPGHVCAVDTTGNPWCWGSNRLGAAGARVLEDVTAPALVTIPGAHGRIVWAGAGGAARSEGDAPASRSYAIDERGDVWAWGPAGPGLPGARGDAAVVRPGESRIVAEQLDAPAVSAAGGASSTFVLTRAGSVYALGANADGELGLGDTRPRDEPTKIPDLSDVVAIAAAPRFACALDARGAAWCWGDGAEFGQLGVGARRATSRPAKVSGELPPSSALALGLNHACALTRGGDIYCWGENTSGELGVEANVHNEYSSVPVRVVAPRP